MFTFTKDELEQFLLSVITSFAGEDGVYDFSRVEDNTRQMVVNRAMAQLETSQPQRDTLLENSLPATECPMGIDEDDGMTPGWFDPIPFDGQPIPYESDDDSPAELGLLPVA